MSTPFDWAPYAVGGAASRPDSFTGLNPDYAAAVSQLLQAADAELGPQALRITSAYRSPEVQSQLWNDAVSRYGSPEAARRWVAPPGHSMHNRGLAVDFADASGGLLRDANSREAQWIAQNAERFGLAVPMSWEPWQVEMAGARRQPTPNGNTLTFGGNTPQVQPGQGILGNAAPVPPPVAPEEQPDRLGLLAELGKELMPQQAQQQSPGILPFTPAQYRPEQRDRLAPYMQLFQSLR